eukprot:TRINITY_DN13665_c0_g1_i1.p1 TRINITY_DN13665_c0_g1~~TRINITY_DN13665_c0_g1_i1.p1  ORF type:complete len:259 (-),score=20.04 TRINITY_DN13665_c0_g1_i1:57-833(-)
MEAGILYGGLVLLICFGIIPFLLQTLGTATTSYGRYTEPKAFGFPVPAQLAWFIQESPCLWLSAYLLFNFTGNPQCLTSAPNVLLMLLFLIHYSQRTLIFPFLLRGGKATPVGVMLAAFVFCTINAYCQMRYLTTIQYDPNWVWDLRFLGGTALFFFGLYVNIQSDAILRNLRKPGDTGYKIPHGGLFEYVSGANFFGEIVEWVGFAIATGFSYPATIFAFTTLCNIGLRGYQHHQWYLNKFKGEYPKSRKAIIPFPL